MLHSQIPRTPRETGILLVVVSAVVFSSAGLFTKGVDASAWAIIFWRGIAAAGFTIAYLAMRGTFTAEIKAFKGPALLVAILLALGTAAFIPAFKLSSVANVALIYAAAPLVAAGLAWALLKEVPTHAVLLASVLAVVGVFIIVSGSLGHAALSGDALALLMTLAMAGIMVVYRAFPSTTAALPAAASSLLLVPPALIFGDPFAIAVEELPILIVFGLVFAVASVTLSEGARRLPSGETALLSALEVPLAPVLAMLILMELPSHQAVIGGTIIFGAVIWSQRAHSEQQCRTRPITTAGD